MKLKFTTMKDAAHGDRFRLSNWMDTVNFTEMFGVEARLNYGVWVHVAGPDNKFFATSDKIEANKFIKDIQDLKRTLEDGL